MVFTARTYASPELSKSPINNIVEKILGGYTQAKKASALPRQIEADIFSKEISPLAALASNPNFTGFNPAIQKMIAQRIGKYLGGNAQGGAEDNTAPGYASGEDIWGRLSHGAHETFGEGKRSAVGRAKFLNLLEQFFLPHSASEKLGGTQASQEQVKFEQAQEEAVKYLTMRGYSENSAREITQRRPGENDKTYSERLKSLFVGKKEGPVKPTKQNIQKSMGVDEDGNPVKNVDEKIERDAQERADAEATAKAFNTTSERVMEALSLGIKTKKEFENYLKEKQEEK